MGHDLCGVVARRDALRRLGGALARRPWFAMADGWAFLPLDAESLDEVVGLKSGKLIEGFRFLEERLVEVLREASVGGELVYVETNYDGGAGGQGAAAFGNGRLLGAPAWRWGRPGPINDALLAIGVVSGPDRDAFLEVGLGIYRDNDRVRDEALRLGA
ncbi:MAG: hypothetical protein R3B68_00330 [Phycisphaerales bacterium]